MSIQGSGEHPTFPAQWLYGLLRALPGEPMLCCHRRFANESAKLDASIWGVGTTRLRRTPLSRSSVATAASTASHPTFVTIAIRPSWRDETGEDVAVIWVRRQVKFLKIRNLWKRDRLIQAVTTVTLACHERCAMPLIVSSKRRRLACSTGSIAEGAAVVRNQPMPRPSDATA